MSEREAEGYDISAVEQWVLEGIPALTPPFKWERLEGGHSNLTYRLQDQSGKLAVIRRPPKGELLPKAHDMSRDWVLISSLGVTGFPVPAAYGFCESKEVTGAGGPERAWESLSRVPGVRDATDAKSNGQGPKKEAKPSMAVNAWCP